MVELIHQGKGIGARSRIQAEGKHRIACASRGCEHPGIAACVKSDPVGDGHAAAHQAQCGHAIGGQGVAQRFVCARLEQGTDIAVGQHRFPGHVACTACDTITGTCVGRAFKHAVFVHRAGELIDRGDRCVVVHCNHQTIGGCRHCVTVKVGGVDRRAKGNAQIVFIKARSMVELIDQSKGISPRCCVQAEGEHRITGTGRGGEHPGAADGVKGDRIGHRYARAFQAQSGHAIGGQ